ncbi:hypothetical protein TWF696_009438 [Orbilia brochopaga]|uniref:Uncharacterized protein n=1 Tax=Orbilia brochopaga TaxID=3140254 RepID=A0AAV9UC57_9PEZI
MQQRFSITTFGQRQQVCTQLQTPILTTDKTDETGILQVTIDIAKTARDSVSQCSSCDNIGDAIAKAVHGGCVEVFRIHSDESREGHRPITKLELDLRPQEEATSSKSTSKEAESTRMERLEARMRGAETPGPKSPIVGPKPDDADKSHTEIILKALTDCWDNDVAKRRRVAQEDEASVSSEDSDETEKASSPKKKENREPASPSKKPVALIQPRPRQSRQGSSIQMVPQPKKSKDSSKKKKKAALKITQIFSPIQAITIYDPPTDTDPTLRNPRAAWAQTIPQSIADELTITHRSSQSFPSQEPSGVSPIFDASARPDPTIWVRQKENEQSGPSRPHEAGRPNIFILCSTEDEKASPHHRTDVLTTAQSQQSYDVSNSLNSLRAPASDDDQESSSASAVKSPIRTNSQLCPPKQDKTILLNRESIRKSQAQMEESITARIAALNMDTNVYNLDDKPNVEPAMGVLRNDESEVAARLAKLFQQRQQIQDQQDKEVDQLTSSNNSLLNTPQFNTRFCNTTSLFHSLKR